MREVIRWAWWLGGLFVALQAWNGLATSLNSRPVLWGTFLVSALLMPVGITLMSLAWPSYMDWLFPWEKDHSCDS